MPLTQNSQLITPAFLQLKTQNSRLKTKECHYGKKYLLALIQPIVKIARLKHKMTPTLKKDGKRIYTTVRIAY